MIAFHRLLLGQKEKRDSPLIQHPWNLKVQRQYTAGHRVGERQRQVNAFMSIWLLATITSRKLDQRDLLNGVMASRAQLKTNKPGQGSTFHRSFTETPQTPAGTMLKGGRRKRSFPRLRLSPQT
uniref:Uncharacterized protein n=1 Tax=Sphaerodactylus townsendi TaxID=933632 RepID=A0ACB8GBH7_9SAUR